jgi:hypothetical protein
MPEIIILFFACRYIGKLALRKGLSPIKWKLITILLFLIFEMIGMNISMYNLGNPKIETMQESIELFTNHPEIIFINLYVGFGGYLLVRFYLEKKEDKVEEV